MEPSWPALSALSAGRAAAFGAEADPSELRSFVERLPGPRSRLHAPEAMAAADRLVLESFHAAGWDAEIHEFIVSRAGGRLDYGSYKRTVFHDLAGANVVATKPGAVSGEAVVAVAHHDTVRDSPGANDNGSAVSVLLAVARLLASSRLRRTVVLATTDMEEIGLFGARALVSDLRDRYALRGAITLETVGYVSRKPRTQRILPGFGLVYGKQARAIRANGLRGDFLAVIHDHRAAGLAHRFGATLAAVMGPHVPLLLRAPAGLPLVPSRIGTHVPFLRQLFRGDHAVFWAAGLAALQVTDTADLRYPHYHEPTDTPERLDYEHLGRLSVATAVTLAEVADASD